MMYNFASLTVLGLLILCVYAQVRPPNFSPDSIPETSFTCEDKITGGYYADVEAECQLFHVCVQVSEYEFQDFRFLCPNDTVFDQQNLVCTNWFEVDCAQSVSLFSNDFGFKDLSDKGNKKDEKTDYNYNDNISYEYYDYDSENEKGGRFLVNSSPALKGNPGAGGEQGQGFQVGDGRRKRPSSTTAIPLGVTTTRRPPRVKSDIKLNKSNKQRRRPRPSTHRFRNPFRNPPSKTPEGQPPRVKSDIKQRNHGGNLSRFKKKNKLGKKVTLSNTNFDFVEPSSNRVGLEIRPDGRIPRVKSDLTAKIHRQNNQVEVTENPFQFIPTETTTDSFRPTPFDENIESLNTIQFSSVDLPLSTAAPDFSDDLGFSPFFSRGGGNAFEQERKGPTSTFSPFVSSTFASRSSTTTKFPRHVDVTTFRPSFKFTKSFDFKPPRVSSTPFIPQKSSSTVRSSFASHNRSKFRVPFISQSSSTLPPQSTFQNINKRPKVSVTTFRPSFKSRFSANNNGIRRTTNSVNIRSTTFKPPFISNESANKENSQSANSFNVRSTTSKPYLVSSTTFKPPFVRSTTFNPPFVSSTTFKPPFVSSTTFNPPVVSSTNFNPPFVSSSVLTDTTKFINPSFITRRPGSRPRVKSNLFRSKNFRPQAPRSFNKPEEKVPQFVDEIDEFETPFGTTASSIIISSTRRPLRRKHLRKKILRKNKQNLRKPVTLQQKSEIKDQRSTFEIADNASEQQIQQSQQRFKIDNPPQVESDERINDITAPGDQTEKPCLDPFRCPPQKIAGGRRPRVKSNIKARKRNFHFKHKLGQRAKQNFSFDKSRNTKAQLQKFFLASQENRAGRTSSKNKGTINSLKNPLIKGTSFPTSAIDQNKSEETREPVALTNTHGVSSASVLPFNTRFPPEKRPTPLPDIQSTIKSFLPISTTFSPTPSPNARTSPRKFENRINPNNGITRSGPRPEVSNFVSTPGRIIISTPTPTENEITNSISPFSTTVAPRVKSFTRQNNRFRGLRRNNRPVPFTRNPTSTTFHPSFASASISTTFTSLTNVNELTSRIIPSTTTSTTTSQETPIYLPSTPENDILTIDDIIQIVATESPKKKRPRFNSGKRVARKNFEDGPRVNDRSGRAKNPVEDVQELLNSPVSSTTKRSITPENNPSEIVISTTKIPKKNISKGFSAFIRPDGRKPRVKSNIFAKSRLRKAAQKDHTEEKEVLENSVEDKPVVRPDGHKPRVKSNILANSARKKYGRTNKFFRHSTKVGRSKKPKSFKSSPPNSNSSTTPAPPINASATTVRTSMFLKKYLANHQKKEATFTSTPSVTRQVETTTTGLPPDFSLLPLFNTRAAASDTTSVQFFHTSTSVPNLVR